MIKYNILLVDDEEIILKSVSFDLKKEGYEVTTAQSGEEAVKRLNDNHFDLVITDLLMEGIDGIQVLKKVKELKPECLVLVLTGYGSMETAIEALRLGAFDYLLKPCNSEELLLRVARGVEYLKLQQKIKAYEQFLPMCCVCKSIRDDAGKEPGTGEWLPLETYITDKSKIDVSHGYCPKCAEKTLKELNTNP